MPELQAHASLLIAMLALLASTALPHLLLRPVGLLLLAGGWTLGFLHNCQIYPDQGLG